MLYLYRDDPGPTIQVGKFTYPWTEIPWDDREEAEACIGQKFGGRNFRLMIKDRSQRLGVTRISVNAPPKDLTPGSGGSGEGYQQAGYQQPGYQQPRYQSSPGYAGGDTARVAETAIHTMANQEKQAVEIGISALKHAADILNTVGKPAAPSAGDDITRQLMAAAITRMTAPPPDPLETLVKLMAVMKELRPEAGAGTGLGSVGGSVIDKVVSQIIERGLNPPAASGSGTVSTSAELIRALPSIATHVTKGIEEYRRIIEAQRDIALRGGMPGPGPVLQPSANTAPPGPRPVVIQSAPPVRAEEAPMFDPKEFIETKVIEIFNDQQSAEAAAEEALGFLDRMSPEIVPELTAAGEQGLLTLFHARPILKPATTNMPRLTEFIHAFVKFANEPGQMPPAAGAPN